MSALKTPWKTLGKMPCVIPYSQQLFELAYLEDLSLGDVTSQSLPHGERVIQATGNSRQAGVFSGQEYGNGWIQYLNQKHGYGVLNTESALDSALDSALTLDWHVSSGDTISVGQTLFTLSGSFCQVLMAERILLNGLQHLCGVATLTHQYTQALSTSQAKVAHTRKTLAGWRGFEQKAVLDGGGVRHRFNLGMAVMIKDNHIAAMGGDIAQAIRAVKANNGHTMCIEVEVDSLEQLAVVLAEGVDVVMLDNFTPQQVKEAVSMIGQQAVIEVSGGITLDTVKAYGEAGAQVVSTSQMTLGAPPLDIGLDMGLDMDVD